MRISLLTLLVASSVSCSTIMSKKAPDSELGNAYSGVQYNGGSWACWTMVVFTQPYMLLAVPVIVPVLVVDLGLSFVADTVLVPVDLAMESKNKNGKKLCSM